MKQKEFEKMSFEQLIKWGESDDSIEATSTMWDYWSGEVKKKAKGYFWNKDFSELERFYKDHPHDDIPPWSDAWFEAIRGSWPFSEIFDRLAAFEKSLDVILKKIGAEDAGISINQLIRLKRGHSA